MSEIQKKLRKPSPEFIRDFVRFYFNHRNSTEMLENAINGFTKQGYDMDLFYWYDPQLEATKEDLREILKSREYNLEESEIEKLLSIEPTPLPDFKTSKVLTYQRHQKKAV